jgi:hypothetical protein
MKTHFKKIIKTLTISMIVGVFCFSAFAQSTSRENVKSYSSSQTKQSLGIGIGQTMLMGDFEKNGENSITTDIFYSYNASRTFDFVVNLHMSQHDFKGRDANLFGLATSIKSKIFDFDAFSPYFIGGVGFYRPTTTREVAPGLFQRSKGKMTFGLNAGLGADLKLNSNYTVGLLSMLHKPFDVKQENQGDVKGAYFKLLLTTSYSF